MDEWLDFSELIDKTQELIELGLHDEALKLLDEYSRIYGDEWEIYFLFSRIYTEQNQPDKAIPCLHKGLKIDKTNADCLLGLFYAYAMKNQVAKGARYLFRAHQFHPENELIISSLIWYYTEINEIGKAIELFKELSAKGISNPEAFRNGALAFERAGQRENAEKCFKAALELNPAYDEVRDLLADHYLYLEQAEKAISLYQEALKESPRNIRILSRLVFCYSQAEKPDQASSLAKEIIRLYPNSPVGYVDLAYVALNAEDFDKAIECAEKALDISPIDPEAFRVKALACSEKKDFDTAEKLFQTTLSMDPENTEILRDYYHHLRNAGCYEEMEKCVNNVIRLEQPYCTEDYWFLADYYREKEQISKSFHFLNKAYKSMPGEKELIPPMVDIMLERGHAGYSLPFLFNYVEDNGWNEVMNEFAHHKRMKSKWAQESIRLLRFFGRSGDYRDYVFSHYLRRFIIGSAILILLLSTVPLYLLWGISGIIFLAVIAGGAIVAYAGTRSLARKVKASGG